MKTENIVQSTGMESKWGNVCQGAKRIALSGTGKCFVAIAVLLCLASIPLLTKANPPNNKLQLAGPGLEGSWINYVSPILPPGVPPVTLQAYVTFAAGGASIGSDRTKPFASPQHGTWVHVRGHQYTWTFIQDLFDEAGTFLGTFKGRALCELIGEDEFVGVANVEQSDADGNIQLNRCARFHALRILPEPLAPPCEDLEPGM